MANKGVVRFSKSENENAFSTRYDFKGTIYEIVLDASTFENDEEVDEVEI